MNKRWQNGIQIFLIFLRFFLCSSATTPHFSEYVLQKDLFEHYNVNVRPLLNHSNQVVVTIGLDLRKIQALDEIGQSFKTTVNIELFWKDEFLTWNETKYHGISSIVFPFRNNIWIPDLLIYNALDKPGDLGMKEAFIRLYSSGHIFVWTQVNIETYCEIKTKKYPYDEQTCSIAFAKFMSSDEFVTVQPRINGVDLRFYVNIAEWEIRDNFVTTSVTTFTELIDYLSVSLNYTRITFTLKLGRSCKLCFLTIILPVLVLAVLDLLSFFVPCESGEKTSYPLSMFLTLAVFLTIITQSLPESIDGVSCLGSYVTFQLAISAVTLMSAVISLYLHYSKDNFTRVPKLVHFASYLLTCDRWPAGRKNQQGKLKEECKEQEQNETEYVSNKGKGDRFIKASFVFDRLMFFLLLLCQGIASVIFIQCVYS